jgi:hypothetical protein
LNALRSSIVRWRRTWIIVWRYWTSVAAVESVTIFTRSPTTASIGLATALNPNAAIDGERVGPVHYLVERGCGVRCGW